MRHIFSLIEHLAFIALGYGICYSNFTHKMWWGAGWEELTRDHYAEPVSPELEYSYRKEGWLYASATPGKTIHCTATPCKKGKECPEVLFKK